MNNVVLRGRLTVAPETKITNDEKRTTTSRFTLAVQDRTHRNHNGDYDTDFIKIVAFNTLADIIQQYTDKGSEVLVTGRLHTYTYKNSENRNVYMAEIIAEKVEFITKCNRPEIMPDDIEDDTLPFN